MAHRWIRFGAVLVGLVVAGCGSDSSTGSTDGGGAGGTSGAGGASGGGGSSGSSGAGGVGAASGAGGSGGAAGSAGTDGGAGSAGTSGSGGAAGSAGTDGGAGSAGTNGSGGAAGSAGTDGGAGSAGASGSGGAGGSAGADGGAKPIYLFPTTIAYAPDFGGRSGADGICDSRYTAAYTSLGCTHVHAFISVDANDEISDMPANYGVPTTVEVDLSNGTRLATSWADLLDSSIENPLSSVFTSIYWTGSSGSGSVNQTCKGWTVADASAGGTYGNNAATDKNWLWQGGLRCDQGKQQLACMCW